TKRRTVGRCAYLRVHQPGIALVDGILERFAGFEAWHPGGADLNRLTGLRIASGARGTVLDSEGAKTHQRNAVTFFQAVSHGFNHGIQSTRCGGLGNISRRSNGFDQLGFVHSTPLDFFRISLVYDEIDEKTS